MKTLSQNSFISLRRILLSGIFFTAFFQLLNEFVESIYLFGLLGTDIPPEIGLVLLFLAPLLLLLLNRPLSSSNGLRILISIGLLARAFEILLPTRGRLIVSGIGFAVMLLFFPAKLSRKQKPESSYRSIHETSIGLGLAVFALILFRALDSGSDLSATGMFRIISWALVACGLVLTWQKPISSDNEITKYNTKNRFSVNASTLGMAGIITLLYFAITAPNIITRWGESSNLGIHILLLGAWLVVGYWRLNQEKVSKQVIMVLGLVFVICLVLSIFPHQVEFPPTMEEGYPLAEPQVESWQSIPIYFMVAFSPALLLAFIHYLTEITNSQPSSMLLSGAFSIGSGFLLIMVLSQVFTTVYDYIPVIGPAFRDKYWIVFLVPGILSFLPLLVTSKQKDQKLAVSISAKRSWLWLAGSMTIASVIGILLITANPTPPIEEKNNLRVFTYNIQQGFNDQGERNFDGQLKLIRSMSPDIIGLQECDTARIAGGNADVVANFANHLNMYSYYGPSSVAGTFGIALLSRYPIQNASTYYLFSFGEQVAVIEADITVSNKTFKIYVTHLGNGGPIFQMRQMLELMQDKTNVIAMGDFNFRPYEEQYAITTEKFLDAYLVSQQKTIPSLWGNIEPFDINERIDHIFISESLHVPYLEYLTQPESDHLALFAEIGW